MKTATGLNIYLKKSGKRRGIFYFLMILYIGFIVHITGCTKDETDRDTEPPTVLSVNPADKSTIAVTATPEVTFSEAIDTSTISMAFIVSQGNTNINGRVSYSEMKAKFIPLNPLNPSTIYTCTIKSSVRDISGNAMAANYTWTFTTSAAVAVDNTPPAVTGVAPVSNATGIAVSMKPSVTFSEPMNTSTVNTTTFNVKQGSIAVSGTINWSGNTVTFTPSSVLLPGTIYTATITTAVKDVSGNSLASNYIWSFTTASALKSFSADVVPILNICNSCHKHNWTPSATPSTFHSNLVSSGHINLSTPTSGKIYKQVNGGHPSSIVNAAQKSTLLTWIIEGSKNN